MAASEPRAHAPRRSHALSPTRHAVYRLATNLLLVFKPRGHRERAHAHPYRQSLQVLRGRLAVTIGSRRVILASTSRRLMLRAGSAHETEALEDTWLVAETPAP